MGPLVELSWKQRVFTAPEEHHQCQEAFAACCREAGKKLRKCKNTVQSMESAELQSQALLWVFFPFFFFMQKMKLQKKTENEAFSL